MPDVRDGIGPYGFINYIYFLEKNIYVALLCTVSNTGRTW
jgi:hypothetical protein